MVIPLSANQDLTPMLHGQNILLTKRDKTCLEGGGGRIGWMTTLLYSKLSKVSRKFCKKTS